MKSPLLAAIVLSAAVVSLPAQQRVPPLAESDFEHLLAAAKPGKNESPWREIGWMTNITEARRRAVAENKPLVIFTAADGSPLGRT